MNEKDLKDMNEEELREHENELYEWATESAQSYVEDTLPEEHLTMLKDANFDMWHWVCLCLQEGRVYVPDVIKKMIAYKE